MNTRILNALKQTTLIEEKQKASHCFVEDMPPYAINQELSLKEHGRVLSNYFFKRQITSLIRTSPETFNGSLLMMDF